MALAGAFSIFAGVYEMFPRMTGRRMPEGLGKRHFRLSLACLRSSFKECSWALHQGATLRSPRPQRILSPLRYPL
ncbi:MAG TPA: hypothetical protein VHX11_11240 [Acidobacteriaceae bacterium]|nr:hypothetical protein [Acidobacteriaceae bacterium]